MAAKDVRRILADFAANALDRPVEFTRDFIASTIEPRDFGRQCGRVQQMGIAAGEGGVHAERPSHSHAGRYRHAAKHLDSLPGGPSLR